MARKLFNLPVASAGIVLSTAYRDYGNSGWKASQNDTWQDIHNNSRWVTLKVMKDNPYFDIDWNIFFNQGLYCWRINNLCSKIRKLHGFLI